MYARERVRPKLYDLDSEKLSRLFADLRRESVATGSFPITVRHLESMIRMAEASARMSLREYVRADDIDLAISVAVESFVNAQKMSIKKTLQRVRASSPYDLALYFRLGRLLTESFVLFHRASESISRRRETTKSCSLSCWARS
jgi:DNA replication licensing factor MCM2